VKDELDVYSVRSQLAGESDVGLVERIVAAYVDPDGHSIGGILRANASRS
jgi:hypothetical protein